MNSIISGQDDIKKCLSNLEENSKDNKLTNDSDFVKVRIKVP